MALRDNAFVGTVDVEFRLRKLGSLNRKTCRQGHRTARMVMYPMLESDIWRNGLFQMQPENPSTWRFEAQNVVGVRVVDTRNGCRIRS